MLVDNKFIYISLPRTASTAFYYTCLINNIDVKHTNSNWALNNSNIDFNNVDKIDLMNHIEHGHERLIDLKDVFGNNYPIISVKRNRHDRFYSLFKHALFDLKRIGSHDIYEFFKSTTDLNKLFFFTKEDIVSKQSRWDCISEYLKSNNLIKGIPSSSDISSSVDSYSVNILDILLTPTIFWHGNDKNIIWFDFDKLYELEDWVSKKINKEFKIQHVNSSKHIDCELSLNSDFIQKYNYIYDYYDIQKEEKTLI